MIVRDTDALDGVMIDLSTRQSSSSIQNAPSPHSHRTTSYTEVGHDPITTTPTMAVGLIVATSIVNLVLELG
jgi:hypothetical protein